MAIYQAAATGPIAFLNSANNQYNQLEIPLSAIFFSSVGIDATTWPEFATYSSQVTPLLSMLSSQGYLTSSPTALSPSAVTGAGLTATAVATLPVAAGNNIAIKIANPSVATGQADVTVSLTETYSDVTPAGLAAAIGNSAATALGLVYDATSGTASMPGAFTGPIASGSNLDIDEPAPNNSTIAFTLAPTITPDAADAPFFQVVVTPASGASPTTFSLTVTWSKSVSGQILANLTTTNPFSYLVTFSGSSALVPAAGTITLSGGSGSTPASASLLANS
jgi:hypothetical protein